MFVVDSLKSNVCSLSTSFFNSPCQLFQFLSTFPNELPLLSITICQFPSSIVVGNTLMFIHKLQNPHLKITSIHSQVVIHVKLLQPLHIDRALGIIAILNMYCFAQLPKGTFDYNGNNQKIFEILFSFCHLCIH